MDVRTLSAGMCLFATMLLTGCDSSSDSSTPAPASSAVHLDVPLELTLQQRTTKVIRGSENRLSLTIDDITGNQVMVSLGTDTGETPIPMRSMSPRDEVEFEYGGQPYSLVLQELDNALIGEDLARFTITALGENSLNEPEKIEHLIAAVASLEGATFIRNGTEHSAQEAADHLRTKWNAARDQITTARQFIDELASKSSLSGEPYQIRLGDGTTTTAAEFLNERLAKMSTR